MENPTVSGLRSRSRSKTPFLRSSCDRENCVETEEHTHKSGRKTPIRRSTPVKQLNQAASKAATETIEEIEERQSPPAHRTRLSARTEKTKTSDYSSEESLDRARGHRKEIIQNEINNQYERVSTSHTQHSQRYGALGDLTLSPIGHNVTLDRSSRFGSPAYSGCSTDSSFAEQALADASALLDRDPSTEHLPYKLYKLAGEYWNKYPKTDYTYSPLSKDRVELAPGQVAVPNMSRRSLSQFRVHGPNTSDEELRRLQEATAWTSTSVRKRFTSVDSSDDESYLRPNGGYVADQRWWITRLLLTVLTTVTSTVSGAYRSIAGPSQRYPYADRRPAQASIASRAAAVAVSPLVWVYMVIKKVVTTTVTTVTETITPNHVGERGLYAAHAQHKAVKRRWWPWILLLLLPLLAYGSQYTYENMDRLAMPNFTDFAIDLKEFTAIDLPTITLPSLPNISLPALMPKLPDINITLPDINENLPEVSKAYREYRDIVQNRVGDATEYVKVVAESCFEEVRRFWHGVVG